MTDLPSLQSVTLGDYCFNFASVVVFECISVIPLRGRSPRVGDDSAGPVRVQLPLQSQREGATAECDSVDRLTRRPDVAALHSLWTELSRAHTRPGSGQLGIVGTFTVRYPPTRPAGPSGQLLRD